MWKSALRLSLLLLAVGFVTPIIADEPEKTKEPEKIEPAQLNEAEQAFQDQLNNAVLVGYFSMESSKEGPNRPERYEIRRINKVSDSTWMFQTRVKYGSVDTVVPILVPIKWAEDTPMVSLTEFTIPGLGTFTCRVLFYEDRYAGTWQHGKEGGHMWGNIEKAKSSEPQSKPTRRSKE